MTAATISYSDISTFKWCRRKWQYQCLKELADTTLQWDLLLGSAVHYGIEQHLLNLQGMREAVKFWWAQTYAELSKEHTFTPDENLKLHEQIELSCAMADAYSAWSRDNDIFRVVAIEYEFCVPIPGTDGYLKGIIDGVVEVDGSLWILEHKTRTRFDAIEVLALDDQTSLYQWALTQLVRSGQFFDYDPETTEVCGNYFTMLKKEAIGIPKLLKSGMALSQDKSASTSYELFLQALDLYGFALNDYEATLQRLQLQGHPTIRRFIYMRPESELAAVCADLVSVYRQMDYAQEHEDACYPTHSTSCRYCPFFEVCKLDRQRGDVKQALSTFRTRPSREQARLALLGE